MKITLKVWRQANAEAEGEFETHPVNIDDDASFLEMLDVLNDRLVAEGKRAIAFDHDCREGICGSCSLVIDGTPHGPKQVTSCQIYMRDFADGAAITVEPFRNNAFPVLRDLIVDRSPLDRIIEAGGYISVNAGPKPEPNSLPINVETQEAVMDAAICIGCGACVAACPNGSSMLFTGAKVTHLNLLPQGQPEKQNRVRAMVNQQDEEGFGGCTNYGECQTVCPQNISIKVISELNHEYRDAMVHKLRARRGPVKAQ
ncbi:succinate dehydrogenase/fumarate reductase iron-sulfur subunit [soil metagenome]